MTGIAVKLFVKFQTLMSNKDGQGMVEYGLIIALISIAAIAAILLLGPKLVTLFTNVNTSLTPPTP